MSSGIQRFNIFSNSYFIYTFPIDFHKALKPSQTNFLKFGQNNVCQVIAIVYMINMYYYIMFCTIPLNRLLLKVTSNVSEK